MSEVEDLRRQLAEKDAHIRTLEAQLLTDPLTELANRKGFEAFFAREQELMRRGRSHGALFVLIDLDRFKEINDTHGHQAGDACLTGMAERLRAVSRKMDCAARFGGDEFALIFSHMDEDFSTKKLALLREALSDIPVTWEGRTFRIGASVGAAAVAAGAEGITPYEACYRAADSDLYRNKRARKDDQNQSVEKKISA